MITNIMNQEKQPLTCLETLKDEINVRRGAYTDLNTKLIDLQNITQALISTEVSYAVLLGKTANVTPDGDFTVLSASASNTASTGTYTIDNITMALEHLFRSDQRVYSGQALGESGTIILGGAASRTQSTTSTIANTVTTFGVATIDSEQKEICTGTYFAETRDNSDSGWEFRLVDSEGKAVSIKNSDGSCGYTNNWQSIQEGGGTYDSGRGLTIDF
jgi:flagellar capping protein FliD